MSLFEKHKSIIEGNVPFGVVIENNTNKDAYVDFFGVEDTYGSYRWNNEREYNSHGIKVYPLYRDMYLSDMTMLMNYISSKGAILVDVTKFQSSTSFNLEKKYSINIRKHDASGFIHTLPMEIESNEDGSLYTKKLNKKILIDMHTSFGMTIDKYTDMIIKFYPHKMEEVFFSSSFYNNIKNEDIEKLNKEKRKRIRIII
jgi:hypothetical protein